MNRQSALGDANQPLDFRSQAGLRLQCIRRVGGVESGEQLAQRGLLPGLLEEARDLVVDLLLGIVQTLEVLSGFLEERIQSGSVGRLDGLERPGPALGLLKHLRGGAKVGQRPLTIDSPFGEGLSRVAGTGQLPCQERHSASPTHASTLTCSLIGRTAPSDLSQRFVVGLV